MKRIGFLYEKIHDYENLRIAFIKASRGKRHRKAVIEFQASFDENMETLRKQLINHDLDIGHNIFFTIYDPKKRDICAASFPERVLHHAIMNVCGPILESYIIDDSYACRINKGSHKALDRAKKFCKNFEWYLKLDIRQYFNSIDHLLMIRMIEKKIKDQNVLALFFEIMDTYHTEKGKGLPIGSLISQNFANYYLAEFDHWIKETLRIKGYIRYMDDFLIFGNSSDDLKKTLEEIKCFLDNKLSLTLKPNIQLNQTKYGIPFLGYRVFSNKLLLSPQGKRRFIEKFKRYENNWLIGKWTTETLSRHVEPLMSVAKKADSYGFRNNVINRFGVWF